MPWDLSLARLKALVARQYAEPTWLEPGRLLSCAYPHDDATLAALADAGIDVLINLHERPHPPARLAAHRLREVHLPVRDFTAPSPDQLETGVATIVRALQAERRVAVHCGAGLGRTGTLLACYYVDCGLDAADAVARVRAARPGSVETLAQLASVEAFYRRRHGNR